MLTAPAPARREAAAVSIARRWLGVLLKPPFEPPPRTPFLAFAEEGGRADVVRAAWGVGRLRVEMARTRYLIAVKVDRDGEPDKPVERRAEAAATALFRTTARFSFKRLGEDETGSFGERNLALAGSHVPGLSWVDSMHFWAKERRIGFLMMRASGGATREFIGADEGLNRVWFDPREPHD